MLDAPDILDTDAGRARREEALVGGHLHLVPTIVAEVIKRVPKHVFRDDLTSAAMSALAMAARHFDPNRGVAFDRYASTRMRGALIDELRAHDWASRSVRSRARKVAVAREALTAELGYAPSREELAERCGFDLATVDAVESDLQRAMVYNYESMVAEGLVEDLLPADERSPDVVVLERERKAYLIDAVAALPDRLRHVVVGSFFEERSMRELAEALQVTESRICQMRTEALGLIREAMDAHLDPEAAADSSHDGPRVAKRKAAYVAAVAAGSDFRSRVSYRDTVGGGTARLTRSTGALCPVLS